MKLLFFTAHCFWHQPPQAPCKLFKQIQAFNLIGVKYFHVTMVFPWVVKVGELLIEGLLRSVTPSVALGGVEIRVDSARDSFSRVIYE